MDFGEYQKKAETFAIYKEEYKINYPIHGLCSEVGEVADKWKKIMRDQDGFMSDEDRTELLKEIGDCLWYLALICRDIGMPLDMSAIMNLQKLESRKGRNKIKGSGDNR